MGILEDFYSSYYWVILFVLLIYFTVKLCCRTSKPEYKRKNDERRRPRGPAIQRDFSDSKNTNVGGALNVRKKRKRFVFKLPLLSDALVEGTNLSCYQCVKNTHEECGIESLLPCSAISDRCVTHITKNDEQGFILKRECGLGPCGFDDDMMNKGLGWDTCDRSNNEYVCLFCCKDSGCNKSGTLFLSPSFVLIITLLLIVLLNIFERFQPPYVARQEPDI